MVRFFLLIFLLFYGCDLVSVGIELPENSSSDSLENELAATDSIEVSIESEAAKLSTVNRLLSATVITLWMNLEKILLVQVFLFHKEKL
jgi:hypothetical protein